MSRQYLSAGKIIDENIKGNSLKSYCSSLKTIGKVDYALALQTIKYKSVILKILELCNINVYELDVKESVLLVMIYELLFGNGKITGGGKVKRIVMELSTKLNNALIEMMAGKSNHSELLSKSILDYSKIGYFLRVNVMKISFKEGLSYVQNIYPIACIDPDIPSLISLPSNTNSFGQDPWVKDGKLVIQDKASCFPSQILYDEWLANDCAASGDIIDACAAPGNKTSHIAMLLSQHQHTPNSASLSHACVFAFDKSTRRAQLLQDRMKQMGIEKHQVRVLCEDFLDININDPLYQNVTGVLLDPSCSGSGVVRSLERAVEMKETHSGLQSEEEKKRLMKLQSFQIQAIEKAMTFHQVNTIVYSTCSIHEEENEIVVAKILANHENWKVVAPKRFIHWTHRGNIMEDNLLSPEQTNTLIRCNEEDGTNGFFVAVFKRNIPYQEHVNNRIDISTEEPKIISVDNSLKLSKLDKHISKSNVTPSSINKQLMPLKTKRKQDEMNTNNYFCGKKLFKVQRKKRK